MTMNEVKASATFLADSVGNRGMENLLRSLVLQAKLVYGQHVKLKSVRIECVFDEKVADDE